MAKKKQNIDKLNIKPVIPDNLPDVPELRDVPSTWPQPSEKSVAAMKLASGAFNTKHGLFASIPLVCKGHGCPYASTCIAIIYGLAPEGERCPVEIAGIAHRFKAYCDELNIDEYKLTHVTLVKELIDCEIIIERCNQLLAAEGELIVDVIAGISESGETFQRPEIHKALDIKDRNLKRKNEILQLLNSTPKDKAKSEGTNIIDPSQYASSIMQKFMEAQTIQDAEFEEID